MTSTCFFVFENGMRKDKWGMRNYEINELPYGMNCAAHIDKGCYVLGNALCGVPFLV